MKTIKDFQTQKYHIETGSKNKNITAGIQNKINKNKKK